jgi:hypothetical protein
MKPTQEQRVLAALEQRGERGICAIDFYSPTIDGLPPVTRVASRVTDLRSRGYRITATMERRGNARVAVYRLLASPSGSVTLDPPETEFGCEPEPLALDVGGGTAVARRSPYDPWDGDA